MRVSSPLLGTTLELPERPARIVSLVSSATETLFALGAGGAVAGVTPYCACGPRGRRAYEAGRT